MSSRYQKPADSKFDDLIEDLQNTVARPKLNGFSNGKVTSYTETVKSVSPPRQNGLSPPTSKDYEIDYLNKPAKASNSLISEIRRTPSFLGDEANGAPTKNYKTVQYEYTSSKRSGSRSGTPLLDHKYEKQNEKSESSFHNNIDRFDSLLKDDYCSTGPNKYKRFQNIDSTFPDPLDHSTPHRSSQIASTIEKSFKEKRDDKDFPVTHTEIKKEIYYNGEPKQKYADKKYINDGHSTGSLNRKRDLIFTGRSLKEPTRSRSFREPSTALNKMEEVYQYESKTSSTKKANEVPVRTTYTYESDVTDNSIPFARSPSPARSIHNYNSLIKESSTRRSPSPSPAQYYTSASTVSHSITPQPVRRALFQSSETVHETTRKISPHRSPTPTAFTPPSELPLETSTSEYSYEKNIRSHSPPSSIPKFIPSDPSGHTIITKNYEYSSHTSSQDTKFPEEPVRYFPPPSPRPAINEQAPPKHVDELMASFSDLQSHYRETSNTYTSEKSRTTTPTQSYTKPAEKIHPIETPIKLNECNKPNGLSASTVYYPPGPLFTKKEELVTSEQSQNGKGKMKANRKAMYKYEAGSKMKNASDTKKAVVPLCAPLCCALPCVIM